MTISRALFGTRALILLSVLGAGVVQAQQSPTVASPETSALSKAASTGKTVHKPVPAKASSHVRGTVATQARDSGEVGQTGKSAGHYATTGQRAQLDQYQMAVTPPPVESGR